MNEDKIISANDVSNSKKLVKSSSKVLEIHFLGIFVFGGFKNIKISVSLQYFKVLSFLKIKPFKKNPKQSGLINLFSLYFHFKLQNNFFYFPLLFLSAL